MNMEETFPRIYMEVPRELPVRGDWQLCIRGHLDGRDAFDRPRVRSQKPALKQFR